MKLTRTIISKLLIASLMLCSACGAGVFEKTVSEEPLVIEDFRFTRENFPAMGGSFGMRPLGEAIASIMLGESREEVSDLLDFGNSGFALQKLRDGELDIVLSAQSFGNTEGLLEVKIASDALVFFVGQLNTVKNLSSNQLRDVYSGRTTNWRELGGRSIDVKAFQRNPWSGTQMALQNSLMDGKEAISPLAEKFWLEDGSVVEVLSSFDDSEGALGFTSLFMMEKMGVMKDANIIKVDGVSANEETVKSGEYPICFDYCVYIRADSPHDSPEYILFTWLQDGAGAAFISSQSYLPAR